jgi:hypothetical protein
MTARESCHMHALSSAYARAGRSSVGADSQGSLASSFGDLPFTFDAQGLMTRKTDHVSCIL